MLHAQTEPDQEAEAAIEDSLDGCRLPERNAGIGVHKNILGVEARRVFGGLFNSGPADFCFAFVAALLLLSAATARGDRDGISVKHAMGHPFKPTQGDSEWHSVRIVAVK